MLTNVQSIYEVYNSSHLSSALPEEYLTLYIGMQRFIEEQKEDYAYFDHFTFIRDYVNPLFSINQTCIRKFKVNSTSFQDYTLTKTSVSIFSKNLYDAQSTKG